MYRHRIASHDDGHDQDSCGCLKWTPQDRPCSPVSRLRQWDSVVANGICPRERGPNGASWRAVQTPGASSASGYQPVVPSAWASSARADSGHTDSSNRATVPWIEPTWQTARWPIVSGAPTRAQQALSMEMEPFAFRTLSPRSFHLQFDERVPEPFYIRFKVRRSPACPLRVRGCRRGVRRASEPSRPAMIRSGRASPAPV